MASTRSLRPIFQMASTLFSGFATTSSGSALASGVNGANTVRVGVSGTDWGASTTGANGYYYAYGVAGTIPANAQLVAYTQANAATGAEDSATYAVPTTTGQNTQVNLIGTWQIDSGASSVSSLSALNAADTTAAGTLPPSTFVLPNRVIQFGNSNFALDVDLTQTGTLVLSGFATVTQPGGALNVGALLISDFCCEVTLGSAGNAIGTLAAQLASLNLTAGRSLIVGSVADQFDFVLAGVTSSSGSPINITSTGGGITLEQPINLPGEGTIVGAVSLTASGDILQQSGASIDATDLTIDSTGGRIVLNAAVKPPSQSGAPGTVTLIASGDILENPGASINGSSIRMASASGGIHIDDSVDFGREP